MSDTHTNTEPPVQNSDVEARARLMGWRPKDEWKGDPDKHRSAEEFVEWGERFVPVLKERNRTLGDEVLKRDRQIDSMRSELVETRGVLAEFRDYSVKERDRAIKQAKAEAKAELAAAVDSSDRPRADAAIARIEELDAAPAPAAKTTATNGAQTQPAVQPDPVIQAWIGENDWFNKSQALNGYALEVYGELEKSYPGMSKQDMLAETKRKTVERFPDKFGDNPLRSAPSTVAAPGAPPRKPTKRGYDDLPADARKACDKFVRDIPGFKREEYLATYEWDS